MERRWLGITGRAITCRTARTKNPKNKKFGISSAPDLIINIYKHNFDVASVAEMVLAAADKNDAIAMQILNEEADELLLHINAVMKKMKSKKLDIAFTGSLIANKNIYSDLLRKKN